VLQGLLPDDVGACEALDVLGKRKREATDEARSQVVISSTDAGKDNIRSFKAWVSLFGNRTHVPSFGGPMEWDEIGSGLVVTNL
jgi:hypothetical protein